MLSDSLSCPSPHRSSRGMTLVEIMISSALVLIFTVGVGSVFYQVTSSYHYEVGKLKVNKDIRGLTSEMTDNATYSNYFMIFPSFKDRTKTFEVIENGVKKKVTVDASVNDGESGDCLLLVYHNIADSSVIEKLIGYYRSPDNPNDPASEGPVRRFELNFNPGVSGDIWTLMPPTNKASSYPEVVELSQGLANGKLFYNYRDRSVMVKGNIIHPGSLNKRATNTYNFTISPRG